MLFCFLLNHTLKIHFITHITKENSKNLVAFLVKIKQATQTTKQYCTLPVMLPVGMLQQPYPECPKTIFDRVISGKGAA